MSKLLIIATALLTLVSFSLSSAQRGRKHPPKPKPSPSPMPTVTATPPPSQPPAAPIILSGSNVTPTSFTANWTNSSGATGYRLDVAVTGNFGEYLNQDIDVGNVTSYDLRELSNKNYYYRVRAYNEAGSSANSQPTRVILASGPPEIPIAVSATDVDSDEFTAHWNASEDALGYRVDIATDPQFTTFACSPVWVICYQNLDAGIALFTRPLGLNSNATFYYRVRAYNDVGTSANSNVVTVTTFSSTTLARPTNLAATPLSGSQINLTWSDNSGNETGFKIELCQDMNCNFSQLQTVSGTQYQVDHLAPSSTYAFRVRAFNEIGNSSYSNIANTTTKVAKPGVPVVVPVSSLTSTGFTANWDVVSEATGYRIDLATDNNFSNFVYEDADAGNTLSYSFSGLSSGARYWFRMRAYNNGGTSGNTGVISVQPGLAESVPATPSNLVATPVSAHSVRLTWTNNSSRVDGFKIFRCKTGDAACVTLVLGFTSSVVDGGPLDPDLSANTTYHYAVQAYNAFGGSTFSSGTVTTLAGSPKLFGEQVGTNPKQVRLMYLVPSDKVENPVITAALYNGLRHLQQWYQAQMSGKTFTIAPIEVYNTPHPSSWYSTWAGRTYSYYVGALHDSSWANSIIRFNDPDNRWIVYVDANQPCDGVNGGTQGLSVMTGMDLYGMAGILQLDMCSNTLIGLSAMSRIGGLGHELGHGFDLPHPSGCHVPESLPCDNEAMMMHGHLNYSHTYLRQDEKDLLNDSPFFQVENIPE